MMVALHKTADKEIQNNGTFYFPDLHQISPHQPRGHGGAGVGPAGLCGGGR